MAADEAQIDQDGELYLQVYPLAFKVHTIAQRHGLGVDAQVLNYLSIATRMRFKNLLESMIASSRHRVWSSHQHPPPMFEDDETTPMYHENLISDPRKQLAALERAERGDEARRRKERLARDEQAAAAASGTLLEGDEYDGEDGFSTPRGVGPDGKRKLKKIGPGVAARNMSEDVQKRLANSTALRNLGSSASKYSWLQGGGAFSSPGFSPLQGKGKNKGGDSGEATPSRLPKPKFAPQTPLGGAFEDGGGRSGFGRGQGSGAWGDVSARQAAKDEEERKARLKVTLRDALFALEYERSGGTGYGSGETILYRARAKGPR